MSEPTKLPRSQYLTDVFVRNLYHRLGSLLSRAVNWLRRFSNARRYGIPYYRDKYWRAPSSVRIGGRIVKLSLPDDEGTRIAFRDIFLEDVYGLQQICGSVAAIIDIGAHAGLFSLYARSLFPNATIHAYEPNCDVFASLKKNAVFGSFTVFCEAIGSHAGLMRVVRGRDSVFNTVIADSEGDVAQISVDEAIDRIGGKVDILKLDCEGCEWEIMEQPRSLSAVNFLTMEYHLLGQRLLAEIQKLVRSHGFEIIFVHEDASNNGRIWAARKGIA